MSAASAKNFTRVESEPKEDALPSVSWHALETQEALQKLGSDADRGLKPAEALDRLKRHGPNKLREKEGPTRLRRFLEQFHQPLIYILLVAAAIAFGFGEWVDAAVILGVVFINAIVGYLQEAKALEAISALAKSLAVQATVIRGGHKEQILAEEVVPGDLVLLEAGDKVPADLRLLRSRELRIDESALTGESTPAEKSVEPLAEETVLGDRANMAYSGSLTVHGSAAGIATATGDRTEIGRVSELTASADPLATPLTRKIERFSHLLLMVILSLAALTMAAGLLRGRPWLETLMAAVALSVAAIPEGLPATVTIILAIGVSRMAKRQAIIRRLPAVEALGSATVICSDKTGTLTRNEMTVKEVFAGGERYAVSGAGYDPEDGKIQKSSGEEGDEAEGEALDLEANQALLECLRAGLACNDASLDRGDNGRWKVRGDPTEAALIVAARKAGLETEAGAGEGGRRDALPFESERQYMATLHGHPEGGDNPHVIYLKGSAEVVLARCESALSASGEPVALDREALLEETRRMAAQSLRVLALARKDAGGADLEHEHVEGGLVFLGLQGMIDPPRPEAAEAVAACRAAGIAVKMITGDHALTAGAIARELGIGVEDGAEAPETLTGADLQKMSAEELADAAERVSVFARVAPEEKLRLVEALQSRGHVVAMTGDGVNDAPALRRADIGVAMALTGTEVARETADMVLTDDNFATIRAAVEEGRGVFDNLLKFIICDLPTSGGEALALLIAIALGTALPLLPSQALWINMTTTVLLGIVLAFEPKEKGLMARPPRQPDAPLITGQLIERTILVSVLLSAAVFSMFQWELARGKSEEAARSAATAMVVCVEMLYLLQCRSLTGSVFAAPFFGNKILLVGIAVMAGLQLLFTYSPLMNRLFHVAPLDWAAWGRIWALAFAIFLIVAIEARIVRFFNERREQQRRERQKRSRR
jgi:cation-transporting ATPase F